MSKINNVLLTVLFVTLCLTKTMAGLKLFAKHTLCNSQSSMYISHFVLSGYRQEC